MAWDTLTLDDIKRIVDRLPKPLIPPATRTLAMNRYDRAELRAWFLTHKADEDVMNGINVRVGAMLPEGFVACEAANGRVLAILDMRGDHHPSRAMPLALPAQDSLA
jgi:hypothetical protein